MKRFLIAIIALYASSIAANERSGIEPWQDANQAMTTVPAPLVYSECSDEINPFSFKKIPQCQTLSKYVWVPEMSGVLSSEKVTVLFCLKPSTERLIQCFYRSTDGETTVVSILYRGETI
jgi:hypothetical protein